MKVADYVAEHGLSEHTQLLLKKGLQLFDFFRNFGYDAQDIYLALDSEGFMGIVLKLGPQLFPVRCGVLDIPKERFEQIWADFAEKVPQFESAELRAWLFAEEVLQAGKISAALALKGLSPGPGWKRESDPYGKN